MIGTVPPYNTVYLRNIAPYIFMLFRLNANIIIVLKIKNSGVLTCVPMLVCRFRLPLMKLIYPSNYVLFIYYTLYLGTIHENHHICFCFQTVST